MDLKRALFNIKVNQPMAQIMLKQEKREKERKQSILKLLPSKS